MIVDERRYPREWHGGLGRLVLWRECWDTRLAGIRRGSLTRHGGDVVTSEEGQSLDEAMQGAQRKAAALATPFAVMQSPKLQAA
eukprot:1611928-Amphidinium_carterae.1